MPTRYPTDRFDDLPHDVARVGAHRAPERTGRGWIAFAWAALATGLLVAAGVVALTLFSDSLDLPFSAPIAGASDDPTPSESTVEPVVPVLDPAVSITVLNGTTTSRLANTVADRLVAAGWCGATGTAVVTDGACAGESGIGTRADAATKDVATTTVYYGDPVNESAARAVVQSLGVGQIQLSDVYPQSPITVVLGGDYSAPAG